MPTIVSQMGRRRKSSLRRLPSGSHAGAEKRFRHRLADHDGLGRLVGVLLGEFAPGFDRDAEGAEVMGRDGFKIGDAVLSALRRLIVLPA